jgi:hypothetical protein
LTGATPVAVSPKLTWEPGTYNLDNASTTLGFAIPDPSYQLRGLCLRYYASGYHIEPAAAFRYQSSVPPPEAIFYIASSSIAELTATITGQLIREFRTPFLNVANDGRNFQIFVFLSSVFLFTPLILWTKH